LRLLARYESTGTVRERERFCRFVRCCRNVFVDYPAITFEGNAALVIENS
jgi:hypothetical protein